MAVKDGFKNAPNNVIGNLESPSTGGGARIMVEFDGNSVKMISRPKVPTSQPKPKMGKNWKSVAIVVY